MTCVRPLDWLRIGLALRCAALLAIEVAALLFVVPTLFNLHSDAADGVAALVALVAIGGGLVATIALTREAHLLGGPDE